MSSFDKYLDELFFYMKEFYNFEEQFKTNLSQNYIFGDIACLVDTDEIDNWKKSVSYDECLEFLENYDKINFDKKQTELYNENKIKNKIKFKCFETLNEVCHLLKNNKRISIISKQFFCYINNITYSPTVFNYYTKNNQLIIYFGTGKSLFIPNYYVDKKLDSENIYIIDLPENKQSFIEAIFKNQNMSDTFHGDKSLSMSMNTLLNYTINKNSMKQNKTYNFYLNDEDNIIYSSINPQINNNTGSFNYSYNININNSNNNNNININSYKNIIDIDKPFIKNNNSINSNSNNNKNMNEVNQYSQNNNIIDEQGEDNFDNNKNNDYNNYKDKDKEFEYYEILKQKNNNINNINDINNNNYNNNNDNNIEFNTFKNNINVDPYIQINENQKEIIIKEENKKPDYNNLDMNIINNNIEDEKEEDKNNNQINNIKNINVNSDKEEINDNKPEIKTIIKETKEVIMSTPDGNEIKDDNNNIINSNIINNNIINNNIINTELLIENKENKENNPMIGLDNINGKSSYINSVIQCLSHTMPLTNYFLNENNKNRILKNNISLNKSDAPQLSPIYLNLLENLWINNNQIKSFDPSEFIKNIKLLNISFEKEEENDIKELIIFILEQLDLELNNNKNIINTNNDLNNNKKIIKSDFYKELLSNDSIIYDTFFSGVCEITQECQKCKEEADNNKKENNKTYEYRNLNYLMFPLNEVFLLSQENNKKDIINIYDCLNYFQNPLILDGDNGKNCEKCGKLTPYLLTKKINTIQNNLLIFLSRNLEKEKNIQFKIDEIIDMNDYVKEKENDKQLIYNLYSIICLSNNKDIHYIAFCKNHFDKKWYKYDDANVEEIKNLENDMFNYGFPIALFYEKVF